MKSKVALNEGCIKLCSALPWNWMQFLPWVTGMTVAEIGRKFSQWIGEIETADGTLDFRWALIIPQNPNSRELYVLVGGLSSGSWWFWTRRWAAIMGNRALRAGLIYGFGYLVSGFAASQHSLNGLYAGYGHRSSERSDRDAGRRHRRPTFDCQTCRSGRRSPGGG